MRLFAAYSPAVFLNRLTRLRRWAVAMWGTPPRPRRARYGRYGVHESLSFLFPGRVSAPSHPLDPIALRRMGRGFGSPGIAPGRCEFSQERITPHECNYGIVLRFSTIFPHYCTCGVSSHFPERDVCSPQKQNFGASETLLNAIGSSGDRRRPATGRAPIRP